MFFGEVCTHFLSYSVNTISFSKENLTICFGRSQLVDLCLAFVLTLRGTAAPYSLLPWLLILYLTLNLNVSDPSPSASTETSHKLK